MPREYDIKDGRKEINQVFTDLQTTGQQEQIIIPFTPYAK